MLVGTVAKGDGVITPIHTKADAIKAFGTSELTDMIDTYQNNAISPSVYALGIKADTDIDAVLSTNQQRFWLIGCGLSANTDSTKIINHFTKQTGAGTHMAGMVFLSKKVSTIDSSLNTYNSPAVSVMALQNNYPVAEHVATAGVVATVSNLSLIHI